MDYVATLRVNQNRFLTRITDLVIAEVAGRPVLVSATYLGGGLASFSLSDADLAASAQALWSYPDSFAHWGDPELQLLEIDGRPSVTLTGMGYGAGRVLPLLAGGDLGPVAPLYGATPLPRDLTQLGQIEIAGQTWLYAVRQGDVEFSLYRESANGSLIPVSRSLMPLAPTMPDASLDRIIPVQMEGQPLLVAISGLGNFLASYRLGAQGQIIRADYLTARDGSGFNVPNDAAAVTVEGQTYLVVTSARSSSITTVRLLPNGSMIPVDHVVDELTTRFQRATALATVEVDGRAYVIVGGMDDGISLFTLLPGGRLLHLETLVDDAEMTLMDVSAIVATELYGKIVLFVSSSREAGVTQLSIDPGQIGQTRKTGTGIITGSAGNDMLSAGATTTELRGGDGDDVLVSFREDLAMRGGAGRDLFVATPVLGRILIWDFNPAEDRLDLSQLGMIRSIWQLSLTPFAKGIRIRFGDTLIEVRSADGGTLAAALFTNAMFPVAHYTPPNLATVLVGSVGGDVLTAARGGSEIHGLDGADLIIGSEVEDLLVGGEGNDTIAGGAADDTLQGDAGDDRLRGGEGADRIIGGTGHDIATGEAGDDLLDGGEGGDSLYGGEGRDSLTGGPGNDYLTGDPGDDDLQGGAGHDTLSGGDGQDRLDAGDGDNLLSGGNGDDTLIAAGGADRLSGGAGADLIQSGGGSDVISAGDGNDRVFAGDGDDFILAGAGDDSVEGGAGDDTLLGGSGIDLLLGDAGNDLIRAGQGGGLVLGGTGDDTLLGGAGPSRIEGGAGRDLIHGEGQAETLLGGDDEDTVFGHGGADLIEGGAGRDLIFGGDGDDLFWGDGDDDLLYGDAGDDRLCGGAGRDLLRGGAGSDVFLFHAASDSPATGMDRIADFTPGSDRIDLTALDLVYIGAQDFSAMRQLRLASGSTHQLLQADLDGDGQADLVIRLDGPVAITVEDLLL